jgi:polar amino acid transport system substrate-binding protein
MLTRRRFLALSGGLVAATAAGCAGAQPASALERARKAGAIRVGIAGERPYGYLDTDGSVTGAQPEVARAALATLAVDGLEAVQVSFDKLIPGLRAGQYDMITAGMTITPARCADIAFSRPDFIARPAFLVRSGNPHRIRTFRDVARAGVRLGVLKGATERDYARAAGVADDHLVEYSGQSTLFRAAAAGDVPVAALTGLSLNDELRRNPGSGVEVTTPVDPIVDGHPVTPAGAFATRTEDVDLRTRFDAALGALQASGEWLRITAPFGFAVSNLPPPGLATSALCTS